jgi:hypothetical protein
MKYVQNTAIVMAAAAVILTMAGYVFSSPLYSANGLCLADGGLNSVSDICPLHSVAATPAATPDSIMTAKAIIGLNADVIPHAFGALS